VSEKFLGQNSTKDVKSYRNPTDIDKAAAPRRQLQLLVRSKLNELARRL